ncbi:serine hydrolase [Azospirillum baldaniorum]|uniref:Serine-type D-Ala-D-Ala carboxypeptidase n=1 Tax=Azospirillum baldaniorum TaxID=1064539 RepID=A0A9P1JSY1_9PROT|nr:serine hydrolase domain-containing protein [Azospirillum baldaniorum]AWJ89055.1 serine hydrolase [Azospirillum baldaniorum]TWA80622.1 CubicO group peptidase (beta-lactamase class C family) [Azospirillum brasilense]CCC99182.1 putative Serine-type D-Ala-D-Ala carboxypeptidase [Azospirillum baldaniorum]
MRISRRNLLLAGATFPLLTSCASDIIELRERPVSALAEELDVCSATYATLQSGIPAAPVALSGCGENTTRADTIFQAASLTKPVVAFAALQLVLDGRLDLDAPASHYLPAGYKHFHSVLARSPGDPHDVMPGNALSRISVAQLLNHTSGLPNWSSETLSFESEPGERWGYSGEGFVILQAVIEAITNTELSAYLDENVFGTLGMASTSLIWRDAFAERAVVGTTAFGFKRQVRFKSAVAAASLYTTAADYARFMSALLTNDRLLSLVLAKPVEVDRELGLAWGLGWGIERAPGGPYIWQWGNNPGFRAFAMASVLSKDGFVILTNSDHGLPLAASVARSVLPGEHNAFRFPWVA